MGPARHRGLVGIAFSASSASIYSIQTCDFFVRDIYVIKDLRHAQHRIHGKFSAAVGVFSFQDFPATIHCFKYTSLEGSWAAQVLAKVLLGFSVGILVTLRFLGGQSRRERSLLIVSFLARILGEIALLAVLQAGSPCQVNMWIYSGVFLAEECTVSSGACASILASILWSMGLAWILVEPYRRSVGENKGD